MKTLLMQGLNTFRLGKPLVPELKRITTSQVYISTSLDWHSTSPHRSTYCCISFSVGAQWQTQKNYQISWMCWRFWRVELILMKLRATKSKTQTLHTHSQLPSYNFLCFVWVMAIEMVIFFRLMQQWNCVCICKIKNQEKMIPLATAIADMEA